MDRDSRERLKLAVSELVTNVVRHGHLSDDAEMRIAVQDGAGTVRVTVEQPTTVEAYVAPRDPDQPGGYGLLLLDAMADRWGSDQGPPGRVWFEVTPPS